MWLSFYTQVSTSSCQVFVLFVSLVSSYSEKLLYYSPAVYKDLPSGGGRQGDRDTTTDTTTVACGRFKASKQAKKKKKSPRKISPDSLPPTSMAPSVTFYTFTFSYYCNSALHPFATHIRTCRILLIIMNSGS